MMKPFWLLKELVLFAVILLENTCAGWIPNN